MNKIPFLLLLTSLVLSLFAQEEKPYFQQEVNYTIHVRLDDIKNEFKTNIQLFILEIIKKEKNGERRQK